MHCPTPPLAIADHINITKNKTVKLAFFILALVTYKECWHLLKMQTIHILWHINAILFENQD
jgi:hypothetical protein